MKFDVTKIIKVAAPILTIAATLLTGIVQKKELDETVAQKVKEVLDNQN